MSTVVKSRERIGGDVFAKALEELAGKLGLLVSDSPMPISKFKSDYSGLLRGAMAGQLQQISRGNERYLVLTEEQVIAMVGSSSKRRTLADTLASVQAPSGHLDTSSAMMPGSKHDPYSLPNLGA